MKKIIKIFVLFTLCSELISQNIWTELNTGVNTELTSVSSMYLIFPPNFVVWVCGNNGTVIKSTNRGSNWQNASGNGIPNTVSLVNIYAINQNKSLTAGYTGANTFLFRTSNGGTNWSQVFSQSNGFINAVWMIDTSNGFMLGNPVGGRWSLWKTSNEGVNWDSAGLYLPQTGNEHGWSNCLRVRFNEITFGTNNYRIYRSTDSGINWEAASTGSEQNTCSIWFPMPFNTTGFAGGATLLKTTNSGITWIQITAPGTGIIKGITGSEPCVEQWYIRGDNKIYRGIYGLNWDVQYTAASGNYNFITADRNSISLGNLYAVKDNGGITRGFFHYEGIQKRSSDIPNCYFLSQNCPNPFNPNTNIKFQVAKSGEVKLIIYDVLGREITTLVNGRLKAGTYETEWDGSNYPSGVYFYKLITADYSETKKMVLVK